MILGCFGPLCVPMIGRERAKSVALLSAEFFTAREESSALKKESRLFSPGIGIIIPRVSAPLSPPLPPFVLYDRAFF